MKERESCESRLVDYIRLIEALDDYLAPGQRWWKNADYVNNDPSYLTLVRARSDVADREEKVCETCKYKKRTDTESYCSVCGKYLPMKQQSYMLDVTTCRECRGSGQNCKSDDSYSYFCLDCSRCGGSGRRTRTLE